MVPSAARDYQGRRAGMVSRLLADIVDFGVLLVALAAIYATVAGALFLWSPSQFRFPTPPPQFSFTLGFILLVGYLSFAWAATGSTYGGWLLGLRLVGGHGRRIGWGRALARAVVCALFPLGLFWVVVSGSNRSIQDLLFGTSVIYAWSGQRPPDPGKS